MSKQVVRSTFKSYFHGTLTGYKYGCRCKQCCTYMSEYLRERRGARNG